MTDLQAPGEASSPRKRAFSTSKIVSSLFSFFFVGHFFLPGSGSTDSVESGSNSDRFFTQPKHQTYVKCNPMLDCTYVTGEEKTAVGSPHREGSGQAPWLLRGARFRSEKGLGFDSWPGTFCSWNSLPSYNDWGRREGVAPYMYLYI